MSIMLGLGGRESGRGGGTLLVQGMWARSAWWCKP